MKEDKKQYSFRILFLNQKMSEMINKISSVELSELGQYDKEENESVSLKPIDNIADITVELVVKLGKKKMTLGDVHQLSVGDILEVEKKPGHKVDIYLSDKRAGIGEVVLMDENFGIVISEIFEYPPTFK